VDGLVAQNESLSNPAAMTARVLTDARRAFPNVADGPDLERYAHAAVADLWGDSIRVRSFVPVLALRQVRDMLEGRGQRRGPATGVDHVTTGAAPRR